jgi:hypothetical protein
MPGAGRADLVPGGDRIGHRVIDDDSGARVIVIRIFGGDVDLSIPRVGFDEIGAGR